MHTIANGSLGSKPGNSRTLAAWGLVAAVALLVGVVFYDGLAAMAGHWSREEYSHGYLIPLIAAFMVWRKRRELARLELTGVWLGVAALTISMLVMLLGELSTLYTLIQYAFLLALAGLVLTVAGWRGLKLLWVPLVYLFFMIPLPNFLYNNLSQELQLISSAIGVWVIRLFDISVYLEGNVIDLGVYQLQVVEACSGLRYLFPLMSFGFLCAYLYNAPFWARAVIFLSAIPLTVLMNSFRIGVIGVLVEYWGIEQAEGFLHYFEGWIIFMGCVAILFAEMWLLTRLRGDKRPFRDVFNVDFGESVEGTRAAQLSVSAPLIAAVVLLAVTAGGLQFISAREEVVPDRQQFATFPLRMGDWRGEAESLRPNIERVLRVTDYQLANYVAPADPLPVNLYVAYYDSQRKGASIHSPRSCLPGHDWEISNFGRTDLSDVVGSPLQANRVLISKGSSRQLVYYWFEQRGRKLTSEYAVKWYLLWDAIRLNRTDGALVRLTTPVTPGMTVASAEQRLQSFLSEVYPRLGSYIPE